MRNDLERFVAGYHGEDSMRNKAKKMLGSELKGASRYKERDSMSSPARTNMRLFAEGGAVDSETPALKRGGRHRRQHRRHSLTHEQHDLHLPKRARTPRLNVEKFSEAEDMKRGGRHPHKMHHHENHEMRPSRHHKRHHYAFGGLSMADRMDQFFKPASDFASRAMPRAMPYIGRAYNAAREYAPKIRDAFNTARGMYNTAREYAPRAQEFISKISPAYGEKFGRIRSAFGLKRGGKAHRNCNSRYQDGGTVYEHEMLGEHPSHHEPHINYEHDMRGEREISRPRRYRVHHEHVDNESLPHHSEHHYAMGGVGKIRHHQADRYGRPFHNRVRKGR